MDAMHEYVLASTTSVHVARVGHQYGAPCAVRAGPRNWIFLATGGGQVRRRVEELVIVKVSFAHDEGLRGVLPRAALVMCAA